MRVEPNRNIYLVGHSNAVCFVRPFFSIRRPFYTHLNHV